MYWTYIRELNLGSRPRPVSEGRPPPLNLEEIGVQSLQQLATQLAVISNALNIHAALDDGKS